MITEKAKEIKGDGFTLEDMLNEKPRELIVELLKNSLPTREEFIEFMQGVIYRPETAYDIYWEMNEDGDVVLKEIWKNPEALYWL